MSDDGDPIMGVLKREVSNKETGFTLPAGTAVNVFERSGDLLGLTFQESPSSTVSFALPIDDVVIDDGFHLCPAPGCLRLCAAHIFCCRTHWFKVPKPLRDSLWRVWKHGTAQEHLEVRAECVQALRDAA